MKPHLEDVRCLLGKVASSLSVECVVVDTNMLMEPNFVVAVLVARMGHTRVCRSAVVRVLWAIIWISMGS
jgi:hypothetical protein